MFYVAEIIGNSGPHVFGPFPIRLVRGAADGHAAENHRFKFALGEARNFVGTFEPLENDFNHARNLTIRRTSRDLRGGSVHRENVPQ